MFNDLITDIDFNGELTLKSSDNTKNKVKVSFKFGNLNHNGQIIEFHGTKGKIFHETLLKAICETGLEVINRQ